jgi:hypothetical protein
MLDVGCSQTKRHGISRPDSSAEHSPADSVESAIATWRNFQTELSDLRKSLADASARLATLETTGNLHDAAVMTEIGHLQIFTALLPRRIAAREEDNAKANTSVIEATNQFIREHLGPRVRRLAAETREIVKRELSPHFRDSSGLSLAVDRSERVRSIENQAWATTDNPTRGALEHAQGALKCWSSVNEFETTLGSAPAPGAVNRAPAVHPVLTS